MPGKNLNLRRGDVHLMRTVIPITEQYQHFVADLHSGFLHKQLGQRRGGMLRSRCSLRMTILIGEERSFVWMLTQDDYPRRVVFLLDKVAKYGTIRRVENCA